ncbi:MAG: M4 family metallopeptidase, partial [Nocardioides sp.]
HTANRGTTLPGKLIRQAGQPEAGDPAVDEAATGGQAALDLFAEIYGRNSYDGAGAPVVMTVHYERDYNNAFWNGTQLVFGDGDGRVFERFTKPVDVLAHELTHAVTEFTAGLVYRGQPGALNESISDVFAACTKQRLLGQSAAEADWLIGAGIFTPRVRGRALRDMAAPGTAYDDPNLGRDPQVGHLDDLVVTDDDNGGVHFNSGIPNRAFHLAATAIGGNSWDGAGAIWYAALTSADLSPTANFADFASATISVAGKYVAPVAEAWRAVGVTPPDARPGSQPNVAASEPGSARLPANNPTAVDVTRSGGMLGRSVTGSVDLQTDDPRVVEVRNLVERIDLTSFSVDEPRPDMYVYTFAILESAPVAVPEHQLTAELHRLAQIVLWV